MAIIVDADDFYADGYQLFAVATSFFSIGGRNSFTGNKQQMKKVKHSNLQNNSAAIRIMCSLLLPLLLLFLSNACIAQEKGGKWEPPKDADNLKNPVPSNAATLKDAKTLYTTYCVACHGEKGKGDGVAAAGLNVKPADHSSAAVQNQTDGALFWELTEGHNPMPSYKQAFNETQRWELVNYIRVLAKTQKKS